MNELLAGVDIDKLPSALSRLRVPKKLRRAIDQRNVSEDLGKLIKPDGSVLSDQLPTAEAVSKSLSELLSQISEYDSPTVKQLTEFAITAVEVVKEDYYRLILLEPELVKFGQSYLVTLNKAGRSNYFNPIISSQDELIQTGIVLSNCRSAIGQYQPNPLIDRLFELTDNRLGSLITMQSIFADSIDEPFDSIPVTEEQMRRGFNYFSSLTARQRLDVTPPAIFDLLVTRETTLTPEMTLPGYTKLVMPEMSHFVEAYGNSRCKANLKLHRLSASITDDPRRISGLFSSDSLTAVNDLLSERGPLSPSFEFKVVSTLYHQIYREFFSAKYDVAPQDSISTELRDNSNLLTTYKLIGFDYLKQADAAFRVYDELYGLGELLSTMREVADSLTAHLMPGVNAYKIYDLTSNISGDLSDWSFTKFLHFQTQNDPSLAGQKSELLEDSLTEARASLSDFFKYIDENASGPNYRRKTQRLQLDTDVQQMHLAKRYLLFSRYAEPAVRGYQVFGEQLQAFFDGVIADANHRDQQAENLSLDESDPRQQSETPKLSPLDTQYWNETLELINREDLTLRDLVEQYPHQLAPTGVL